MTETPERPEPETLDICRDCDGSGEDGTPTGVCSQCNGSGGTPRSSAFANPDDLPALLEELAAERMNVRRRVLDDFGTEPLMRESGAILLRQAVSLRSLASQLRASSLGEPVSQEAPGDALPFADDRLFLRGIADFLEAHGRDEGGYSSETRAEFETDAKRLRALAGRAGSVPQAPDKESGAIAIIRDGVARGVGTPDEIILLGEVDRLNAENERLAIRLNAFRREAESWRDVAGAHAEKLAKLNAMREAEDEYLRPIRERYANRHADTQWMNAVVGNLLAIIARLSASAPSPEDKGSET